MYRHLLDAFQHRMRPEHFTDFTHCEECAEHDETLRAKNNDSLSFEDVGNIAYSPISFISTEGLLYYLPGLARLAAGTGEYYFLDTFLIQVNREDLKHAMTAEEKSALVSYLKFIKEDLSESEEYSFDEDDLNKTIEYFTPR